MVASDPMADEQQYKILKEQGFLLPHSLALVTTASSATTPMARASAPPTRG